MIFGDVVVFLCFLWNFCCERMKLRSERGLLLWDESLRGDEEREGEIMNENAKKKNLLGTVSINPVCMGPTIFTLFTTMPPKTVT